MLCQDSCSLAHTDSSRKSADLPHAAAAVTFAHAVKLSLPSTFPVRKRARIVGWEERARRGDFRQMELGTPPAAMRWMGEEVTHQSSRAVKARSSSDTQIRYASELLLRAA
jgi:hypothetical protein